jgi:hypothetical protein
MRMVEAIFGGVNPRLTSSLSRLQLTSVAKAAEWSCFTALLCSCPKPRPFAGQLTEVEGDFCVCLFHLR